MDLITVRELYKHPEEYLDKEINVGAGSAVSVIPKHSASSLSAMEAFLKHCRLYITTPFPTLQKYLN